VSGDGRRSGQPEPVDPLALAEAVAAGRLGFAAAEAALWEAHPDDQGRAANEVAELRDLVAAIRGVRRHAEAVRRADVEVFDPDATSIPLGSARTPDDDRGIAPRRVHGGDVRLRPTARQRPRWAPVGALAAAAVLVVAVAIIVPGLLAPSVASSPVPTAGPTGVAIRTPSATLAPSPSAQPTPNASSVPSPTPMATGVVGVPAIPSEPLAGAPGIAYWTMTNEKSIAITEWRPDGGAPRFKLAVPTEQDPDLRAGNLLDRRIVVSPDGRRIVFAESGPSFARTRVFATDGTLLWTDPKPNFTPDLAWSADGSRLVIGSQPATFTILTFGAAGGAPAIRQRVFDGAAYRMIGLSMSGAILYGWDTNGETDYWQTPFRVPVASGDPVAIDRFSGLTDPVAVSNGTTDTTQVDPSIHGWSHAGIDPKTGRVLDTGDLSGTLKGWEIRDGTGPADGKRLDLGDSLPALSWGPDGSIVVADVESAESPATISTVAADAPRDPLGPTFKIAQGDYWRAFGGSRGGFALLELGAARASDWLAADEFATIDLATARSAVLVRDDQGLTGLHAAGWISAP
jgi:hypothetical protein